MKARTPIRRISKKRLEKEFAGKLPFSTIKRKPSWNVFTAEENLTCSSSTNGTAKHSVPMSALHNSKPPKREWIRKIGKKWLSKPAVIVLKDGREICNQATPEGRAEYEYRKILLWIRQNGVCCNCGHRLKLKFATFEHERLRGKDIDERLEDENGRPINGTSHARCNLLRGSRRTEIYHGDNTSDRLEIILKGITI